jgi:PAS domain S-box-containing protein
MTTEITETRQTKDTSADARRGDGSFRVIVEAAPNAMIVVDGNRTITLVNKSAERLFAYAREELIGQPIELLVPDRARASHPRHVDSFFRQPTVRAMGAGRELFGRRKDGTEVPIEIGLNPVDTPDGPRTLASIIDITERKREEARFRLVVEAAPNAMIIVDRTQTITLVNRKAEDLFGYTREELVGQRVELLVPDRVRQRHPSLVDGFLDDPQARPMGAGRELYGRRKDGTEVPVEIGLSPLEAPDGMFMLVSIIDITERKRHEDELRRSNADLEQFAYIASHDLQEPLRMVASYTELLAQRYQGKLDERADKYIFYAVDGAKRMQRLVADLLAYARVGSQGQPLAPVATSEVVRRVLQLLGPTIKRESAEVIVESEPLPVVMGDEVQLQQLFLNLLGNALKFRRDDEAPRVRVRAELKDGAWLFAIADNGIGVDMQFAERIFQMFQRLHERGKYDGSGIGLSISKRILDRHNGRLWLESELGRGSTFFFTLAPVREVGR